MLARYLDIMYRVSGRTKVRRRREKERKREREREREREIERELRFSPDGGGKRRSRQHIHGNTIVRFPFRRGNRFVQFSHPLCEVLQYSTGHLYSDLYTNKTSNKKVRPRFTGN